MPSCFWTSAYDGIEFLSLAHVYGGPVSSATIEELGYYGIETVLAYGLAGGLGTGDQKLGDVYIVERALALSHPTPHYTDDKLIPSDEYLNLKIKEMVELADLPEMMGVQAMTTDAIYREYDQDLEYAKERGCDIVNCDSSHLFAVSRDVGIRSTECGVLSDVVKGRGEEWQSTLVGFYAPDVDQLADRFDADQRDYRYEGGMLTFPESDELRYIFFGHRNSSPTDQPEHFEHPNGAEALIGIWIAGDDLAPERQLFTAMGGTITEEQVHVPERKKVTVATLEQAEVVFLPGFRQLVPGRRIVGAIIRTRDLDTLQGVLRATSWDVPPAVETAKGRSIFIPPSITHGIWLEFRQDRGG